MARVPPALRLGSLGVFKRMMLGLPITAPAVKMMLKQVGMKRAVESGALGDDMLAWCVAVLRHTGTLRSEAENNSFVSLKGENAQYLFTDSELQHVRMPVLLLWGDEDTNGGRNEAEAFAARLPNAKLEMVPRAGHAPWVDELEVCTALSRAFLRG